MPAYALIAEPDPGQAAIYKHLVSMEGFELEVVRDGDAARGVLGRRGAPVLLICELALPRSDGFALLTELRKLVSAAQTPAVVVSAFRELREAAARMKELGISALLAKSTPVDTLRRTIKRALAQVPTMVSSGNTNPRFQLPAPLLRPAVARGVRDLPHDGRGAEQLRLARVRAMGLGDEQPEDAALHTLLQQAAREFDAGAAFLVIRLEDKLAIRAQSGLPAQLAQGRALPRDWPFVRQVLENDAALVVPDASTHPLFSADALVRDGSVRGFAAAPLEGPGGEVIGALCLSDTKPLLVSAEQLDALVQLARRVSGELELQTGRARAGKPRHPDELRAEAAKSASLGSTLAYLEAALDGVESAVYLLDPARRVAFANQPLAELLGTTPSHLLGRKADDLLSDFAKLFDDPEGFLRRLRVPSSGPFALREEFELQRPQRRVVRWVSKPVQLGASGQGGQVGIVTDVTAQADLMHERETLARTDALTGLANRRGGEESLQREVSRAERGGIRLAFALFDLDHFKQVNDQRGHAAGDDALRAVARVLIGAVRGADLVVRWGGDELLAVLPSTGLEGARSLAERVRAQVEALTDKEFAPITVSAGVAELNQGEDEGQALARADAHLYDAKSSGKNRVR